MQKSLLKRFAALALALVWIPALSATLTVTGNGEPAALNTDDCSGSSCTTLRGAINHAGSGDTIVFDKAALDGQTINLTMYTNCLTTSDVLSATCLPLTTWPGYVSQFGPSAFFISGKTLTIDATANGLTKGVVIARLGAANFRLFDVDSGSNLTLLGLTLANGAAQGGNGDIGGGALGAGGAIFNQGGLVMKQCTLTGNRAQGGGVLAGFGQTGGGVGQGGSNSSGGGPNGGSGGGSGGFGGGGGGSASAGTGGFGGFGGGGGTGDVGGGGGFGGGGGGGFTSGGGGGFGGGFGGSSGGFGGDGGGGAGMGGAVFNDAGAVLLSNVTLTANTAKGGGTDDPTAGNGSGYGGAIFNHAGSMTLDFVTVSGNTVAVGSGGVSGSGGGDGGAIYSLGDSVGNATLAMNHSIAASSTGATNDVAVSAINSGTSSGSGAYNAIGAASGFTASNAVSGALSLGALPTTLGGGLVDVMIPQASSAAIDGAGSAPCAQTTDQRGVSRPRGLACDIGAVEVQTTFNIGGSTSGQTGSVILQLDGSSPVSTQQLTVAAGATAFIFGNGLAPGSNWSVTVTSAPSGQLCTVSPASGNAIAADVSNLVLNCVTVNVAIAPATLPNGTVNTVYSQTLSASSSNGGTTPYTFSVASGSLPTGLTLSSAGVLSGTPTAAGGPFNFSVTATSANGFSGTQGYAVTVAKASQTITFNPQSSQTYIAGGTFPLNPLATASSSLAVGYSSQTASVCTISGTTVTMLATGTCTIAADQAGNANYSAATQVTQNIAIGVASQTITNFIATPANPTFVSSGTFTVSATGGASGNAVTFSIASTSTSTSVCSAGGANGATITMLGVGTCAVLADQAGNATYAAASQATLNVAIGKAPASITLISSVNPSAQGNQVTFTATVSAGAGIAPATAQAHTSLRAMAPGAGSVQAITAAATGTVSFTDGGAALGTVTLNNGIATLATAFTTPGNHPITANYSGDAVTAAASTTITQIVGVAVVVTATPAPALSAWMLALLGGLVAAVGLGYRLRARD